MKKNLLFEIFGLLVFAVGMQPTLIKAENEIIERGKIVAGSIAGAIVYGVASNMAMVRVSPEFFTQGFMQDKVIFNTGLSNQQKGVLFNPKNRNQIALWHGVHETWWRGAVLSIPVTAAARYGSWPQLGMEDLVKPLAIGLGCLLATGAIAGTIGYARAAYNPDYARAMVLTYDIRNDDAKYRGYFANLYARDAGYKGGVVLGAGIVCYTLLQRYKQSLGA